MKTIDELLSDARITLDRAGRYRFDPQFKRQLTDLVAEIIGNVDGRDKQHLSEQAAAAQQCKLSQLARARRFGFDIDTLSK